MFLSFPSLCLLQPHVAMILLQSCVNHMGWCPPCTTVSPALRQWGHGEPVGHPTRQEHKTAWSAVFGWPFRVCVHPRGSMRVNSWALLTQSSDGCRIIYAKREVCIVTCKAPQAPITHTILAFLFLAHCSSVTRCTRDVSALGICSSPIVM